MLRHIIGKSLRWLFFCGLLCLPLWGQDIILDAGSSHLVVSGQPALAYTPTVLTANTNVPLFVAFFDYGNVQRSSGCPLPVGSTINLGPGNGVTVAVLADRVTLTSNNGSNTFTAPAPDSDGYFDSTLSTFAPDFSLSVSVPPATPPCNYPSTYSNGYLRISTSIGSIVPSQSDDDPPIPIVGGSLAFQAPPKTKFSCDDKHDVQSITLEGEKGMSLAFYRRRSSDVWMRLDGISDWRLTAYPQLLEITPSWSGNTLRFQVPSSSVLRCNAAGTFVRVLNAADKTDSVQPQAFVLDYSPGWFRSRRYVQVPCRQCTVLLKGHKVK